MESHARSIAKALSYRLLGSTVTFAVSWAVTRELPMAALIGLGDTVAKVGAYYIHERAWARIPFGRTQTEKAGA